MQNDDRPDKIWLSGPSLKKNVAVMRNFFRKASGGGIMRRAFVCFIVSVFLSVPIAAVCVAEDTRPASDRILLVRHLTTDVPDVSDKNVRHMITHIDEKLENIVKQPSNAAYPPAGPIVEYKGRKLIGSTYSDADNAAFFKWMKWAIDKVDQLPEKLRVYPALIREIRFDPPSRQRKADDANTNIVGVYMIGADDAFPAPMIVYKDIKWGAPLQFAYSLAGNGLRAFNHKRRLAIADILKREKNNVQWMASAEAKALMDEHQALLESLEKTNQASMQKYECRSLLYRFELMKLWEESASERYALSSQLSELKCWED